MISKILALLLLCGVPFAQNSSKVRTYLENLPFANLMPEIPDYEIPTFKDCDWIIYKGDAISTSGLPTIMEKYLIGPAYKASVAAGHELPIVFGVFGKAGVAIFGGGYSAPTPYNDRSVFIKNDDGTFEDLRCQIVGLSKDAEVTTGWDDKWGYVKELGLYNIGIRGENDTFVVRGISSIGNITIDGCWWLSAPNKIYASGIHLDSWERFIWRGHEYRGIKLREHNVYMKSSRGETWIIQNNLYGGNRTGFQIRPQPSDNDEPVGPIVIAGNFARGYGWEHANSDGGSCISVWSNPRGKTFIVGNRITDARYGCLMIGGQSPDRNFLNDNGFPIAGVYVKDNVFENSRAKRSAVLINAVEELHWGPNKMLKGAKLDLNNSWGVQRHGIWIGMVKYYTANRQLKDE